MDAIFKILPVILIFFLGYILKSLKVFNKENADLFLKLAFYVSIPSLIITSMLKITFSYKSFYITIIPFIIVFTTFIISFYTAKKLKLERKTFGSFLIATLIMNMGFSLPFIISVYGNEGLIKAILFDLGNGLLTLTFVYFIACKYGNDKINYSMIIKKFLLMIPLWAFLLGIILNFTKIKIPLILNDFLTLLGNMTVPLIMLSLGLYFSFKIVKITPLFFTILLRMILGFLIALFLIKLFNFNGLDKIIVLIGASSPVGYNTLIFSSLENLDKEFSSSAISVSILLGLIIIPILILLL